MRVIRAFGKERQEVKSFEEKSGELLSSQRFVGKISALLNPVTYVMINLAIIAVLRTGAGQVDKGILTQGQVMALYNYMSQILVELIKMASLILSMTKAAASAKRVASVLALESSLSVPEQDPQEKNDAPAVEFDGVTFTYPTGGAPALSDISFALGHGKTLGIIGVGEIGMAVARRALGFGMDILGNDSVQREEAAHYGLLYVSLAELLAKSDVITIHAPLTPATLNLLGAKEFRRMKDGVLLINTAREDIIRQSALEKALLSGKLGGFATDVYEHEPPTLRQYMTLPNVLTTPHIGSSTFETNMRMGDVVVDNIIAFKDGVVPPNRVTAIDRIRFS